jgi:transposase
MSRPFRKLDPVKVIKLKRQGLSNALIAQRLGVTQGAVYHVLRKMDSLAPQQLPEIPATI